MNAQLLPSNKIDPAKWDHFIRSSPQGSVYHEYESLSALCVSWSAIIISDGDWMAVFPFERKQKYFVHYSFPPMFTQYLGPVISPDHENITQELSEMIALRFKKMGRSLIANFSPDYSHQASWQNAGFKIAERMTYWLDLDRSFANVQKGFSENIRRNIKKGQRRFEVRSNEMPIEIAIDLFRNEVGSALAISSTQYNGYLKWITSLQTQKRATIYSSQLPDGSYAGFVIIIESGKHRIYSMGALLASERNSGLSPLLLSSAITDAIDEGASIFDFEGSMIEGIARFFKSFGSNKVRYNSVSLKKFPFRN